MTWLLIKKQLMEIFRAYFYNEKKQKKRSMGATIGMFVLFFVLMFLFLGGMFYALSSLILPSIVQLHIEWMFFANRFNLTAIIKIICNTRFSI